MTSQDYFRIDEIEDMLYSLENGYYDSYDLDEIERNQEDLKSELYGLYLKYHIDKKEGLRSLYSYREEGIRQKVVLAYTDGSAVSQGKNKGKGGFGTYLPHLLGSGRVAYSLGFKDTKTGRMETMALLYAIAAMPQKMPYQVTLRVYADSEFVVKSFTDKWLEKWIRNNWTNSSGDVANCDVWKRIVEALNIRSYLKLDMRHIRSHQVEKEKDPDKKLELLENPHIIGNMIADKLADYSRHEYLKESDKLP